VLLLQRLQRPLFRQFCAVESICYARQRGHARPGVGRRRVERQLACRRAKQDRPCTAAL